MKKSKVLCWLTVLCLTINMLSALSVYAEEKTTAADKYADLLKVSDTNAWVLLGNKCEGNYAKFIDGIAMGISDSADPLYSENSTELSLDGRKFYKDNYASIKISDDFCQPEDHEFLVSVMYYDYGPSPGKFHIDYISSNTGSNTRISLTKTGEVQDWFIQSLYINDADLKSTFAEGGNIRLASNVYNLFKKVEIVNISKLKREGKAVSLASLPNTRGTSFTDLKLLQSDDELVQSKNLINNCTLYNAKRLLNIINSDKNTLLSEEDKNKDLTQGELVTMYLSALSLNAEDKDPIEYASEIGLLSGEGLFINSSVSANNYNLLFLAYDTLFFEPNGNKSMAARIIESGFYGDDIKTLKEEKMKNLWLRVPQYCPYKKITENETGRTYYYMNIFGQDVSRPYVCSQHWTTDGKNFICGVVWGGLYRYNIETQMLTAIDPEQKMNWPFAFVGTDDYVYYAKMVNGRGTIWKANLMDYMPKSELVTMLPEGLGVNCPYVSNNCKYISMEPDDPGYKIRKQGDAGVIALYSVDEDKWEFGTKGWDYSQDLTHCRINPEYPNLVMFCHEMTGIKQWQMLDRTWVYDFSTNTSYNLYKQGVSDPMASGEKYANQVPTHEMWSYDGEYFWLVMPYQPHLWPRFKGSLPAIVRLNKDGSHRQYYHDATAWEQSDDHLHVSGDNKYVVIDGYGLELLSTETNQRIPISGAVYAPSVEHPNQAHPTVARYQYIVNWSEIDETGVLGVKWYDFTDMTKEFAKGGRYPAGENVERVSYEGIDCDSSEITKDGRSCITAKDDKGIFLNVSDSLIDTLDGRLKLEFDYLDNGKIPITVQYTSGAKSDNDLWRVLDAEKKVKRNGTNQWKHAEVIIDSGNFENAGTHETDVVIKGSAGSIYISDIKASIPD